MDTPQPDSVSAPMASPSTPPDDTMQWAAKVLNSSLTEETLLTPPPDAAPAESSKTAVSSTSEHAVPPVSSIPTLPAIVEPSAAESGAEEKTVAPTSSTPSRPLESELEAAVSPAKELTKSPPLSRPQFSVREEPKFVTSKWDKPTAAMPLPGSGSSSTLGPSSYTRDDPWMRQSSNEAHFRVMQLQRDMRAAAAESPRRSNKGLFKSVCSTDLLFLIDTTGSMSGHIAAAKDQVRSIVNSIEFAFLNEAEVRMSVVGYKDHANTPNIQFLDFTSSTADVHKFLDQLYASGGDDLPEDVYGGMKQAINASWQQQTRCIIHIADAPPHGRNVHDLGDALDTYAEPGSEPHNLTYEPLLKQMIDLHINYALLRINNYTDRMALNFLTAYSEAGADCKVDICNKYYNEATNVCAGNRKGFRGGKGSKRQTNSALLFEELQLGVAYSSLRHLVVRVVTTSASRTAVRTSTSGGRSTMAETKKHLDKNLEDIGEDEDENEMPEEPWMETEPPQWDTPGWLDETLIVEGFSPDVVVHGAKTLNEMMASDENIRMSITDLTIHKRSKPFAEGAMRVAAYARTAASTNKFVVKSFKRGGKRLAHLAEDMRCQAMCKAFALEFNAISGEAQPIDFLMTTCLKGRSEKASDDEFLSLERYIEGTYVKYNNNCGYVNEERPDDRINQAAQAFSHFTFERSRGCFLVSDLQGVGHLLTDPALHTLDPDRFRLSDTNLGTEGFKFFFSTHVCNDICRKLALQSNGTMIRSGDYKFREKWPRMDNTVCCSNKLCGRILRLSSAKKSDKFPGTHWCEDCWPQLASSMMKWTCDVEGPRHEFKVSRFFYESQGRSPPRECPKHRPSEATLSRPAVMKRGFWAKLKSATKVSLCGMAG